MDGAQAMIRTLVESGVTTCFTNPGTSEMHFVAALDHVPGMRAVLGLFEGVATGAADGYARMAGLPAATLLHLGPGLGNGLANLHNARRASTPLVNIVGDHATYHTRFDAPLQSDIETAARNVSTWIRRPETTTELTAATAEAVAAASRPPGEVATLILPADVSWSEGAAPAAPLDPEPRTAVDGGVVEHVAAVLRRGEPVALLLGGAALRRPHLRSAARIAAGTGARLLAATFVSRTERGIGHPRGREAAVLRRGCRRPARRSPPPRARRRRVPGQLLRLPGQAQRPRARRLRGARARGTGRRRRRRPRPPRRPRRRRPGARRPPRAARLHRRVPSPSAPPPRPSPPPSPRAPSSPTRAPPPASRWAR